ncbi:MAG: DNA alkylation repair protein [Bauldia sp.]|nr:DNA alkylation repair protein [Bauldia sp.]
MSEAEIRTTVAAILAELESHGSERNRQGMARYGIETANAYGVSQAVLKPMARPYRRNHALALALWKTGKHEARHLAGLIDDPKLVTPGQMDAWASGFDSWDIVDGVSFNLFDKTAHADAKIREWARDEREFVRRAAFSMIAGRTVHAKKLPDETFLPYLRLIEASATDNRNFVRKAVNWALRQIGKRSLALHEPALALAERLAASDDRAARWIGRDAVRELTDEKQLERLAARAAR